MTDTKADPKVQAEPEAGAALGKLIESLAELGEKEVLQLCDALVDDPRLRDLLEAIDDYLYLEADEPPPINLKPRRVLN